MRLLFRFALPLFLLGLAALALACGPVAPAGQDDGQAETPTVALQPTEPPTPTATLYPPGYVKPTDLPTTTPFPTLPDPPTPEPTVFVQESPGPTLAEQVTQFVQVREVDDFPIDDIALVRVISHREVAVPAGIEWPPNEDPTFVSSHWRRTKVQSIKSYRGQLPDGYELLTVSDLSEAKLEINQEYILFISRFFVKKGEYPEGQGRHYFNEKQLKAFGGKGGVYFGDQVWIVEGNRTWRVPIDHLMGYTLGTDLEGAKAGGESLLVTELEAAIAAAQQ